MTTPTYATGVLAIATAAGGTQNLKVAVMPDGSLAVAHAFVGTDGTMLDPAKDTTVQTATAAIIAATEAFSSAS